ncbi:predicted protein [Naegleria gruberi]|uniref:Predicted protein n=1 Tax=Naegleria gruberi TaxID=5762 RepID=D2W469_NAEGR|nr:uncharacterized protein NAEGRDRAFT_76199 [Naegleria gruberi]EFC36128.1 predicted protein [Naegleria gruberi]|eukprot:XP_002668872.1 predicted protein [Naegleria gruberi strain NEG-M]
MKKLAGFFKGNKNSTSTTDDDEKIKIRKKLLEKAICDWSAKDVSLWLKSIDLQDYCKEFEKMDITGAELLELTDDDLVKDLKISKLGHRKRLKKQLDYLVQHNEFLTEEDDPPSSTSNTTMENQSSYQGTIMQGKPSLETRSMTSYQSTMNDNDSVHSFNSNSNIPTSDIMIKCYDSLENQSDATILRFSPEDELTLQKVKMEVLSRKPILSSTNQIQLKYKDEDDDIITLKKEDDFKLCLANYRNSGQRYLKLYISSNISLPTNKSPPTISSSLRDSNEESSELIQILEGMVDAIVVMTANDKLIKYVKKCKIVSWAKKCAKYKKVKYCKERKSVKKCCLIKKKFFCAKHKTIKFCKHKKTLSKCVKYNKKKYCAKSIVIPPRCIKKKYYKKCLKRSKGKKICKKFKLVGGKKKCCKSIKKKICIKRKTCKKPSKPIIKPSL